MRRRRGSQVVEFALVAPVLLGLIGLALDAGWYMHRRAQTVEAVFTGTRAAMFEAGANFDDAAAAAALAELEQVGIADAKVTTSVDHGDYDTVTVSAEFPFVPLFGLAPTPQTIEYQLLVRSP